MDKKFIIWFAGFMDGEGSWSVYKNNKKSPRKEYYNLQIGVGNTCKKALDYIKENLGDSKEFYIRPKKGNRKMLYCWRRRSSNRVKDLTKKLYPYLIVKKEIAKVILDFPKMNNVNGQSNNLENNKIYLIQRKLRKKSLKLNRRGKI